jgi:hypothetical protein
MAGKSNSERMEHAQRTLREARAELTAEAGWLREKFSPANMVHRTVDKHTVGLLGAAFALGIGGAWMIFHKSSRGAPVKASDGRREPFVQERRPRSGMAGNLLKAALPFVVKYATSQPVLTKIIDFAMRGKSHPARHAAA